MIQPSRERALDLAAEGRYGRIPVWESFEQGDLSPARAFLILKNQSRQCFILDSAEVTGERGRYTFLGFDPLLGISCLEGEVTLSGGADIRLPDADPNEVIARILAENASPRIDELPPFTGGLVGYFSFEYFRYMEPSLVFDAPDVEHFKDVDLMLFDKVVAFDHQDGKVFVIVNMRTDAAAENYNRAITEIANLRTLLSGGVPATTQRLHLDSKFRALFDEQRYCAMIERARDYIHEGDIFQVVLSNRLEADAHGSLFGAYQILRESNPSPYMFYFSSDDVEIAGAAPETLVRLNGRTVMTFPLAGTRPRGETPADDEALERDLLSDPKELAEHNMLVDLGRNDIGRISEFGSVQVDDYLSIQRFSHVMHIGSTVTGTIQEGKTGLDAIAALLPAGTLSGAPKVRACEIIGELENCRRGIYGGAIGYLGFDGDMDTCIAIRIAYKKNGKVFVRSGAGIVADSDPATEYLESQNKMQAVILALKVAQMLGEG